jgi:phosphoglycerol transferase MdoB-like AlkP superfamily enzyme
MVLYVQFVGEYAGVYRLFPYLVVMNILLSLTPGVWTLYNMKFGGELYFVLENGECFIGPTSAFPFVLIIPFAVLLILSIFMTIRVYIAIRSLATDLGNIQYKSLFMYPAVLVLLDVPISVDYATSHQVFWLTFCCLVMFKSIGLINALQFRRASNNQEKLMKESQQDVILRTLTQDGESSFT